MEGSEGGLETAMATVGTSFVWLSSLFLSVKSTGIAESRCAVCQCGGGVTAGPGSLRELEVSPACPAQPPTSQSSRSPRHTGQPQRSRRCPAPAPAGLTLSPTARPRPAIRGDTPPSGAMGSTVSTASPIRMNLPRKPKAHQQLMRGGHLQCPLHSMGRCRGRAKASCLRSQGGSPPSGPRCETTHQHSLAKSPHAGTSRESPQLLPRLGTCLIPHPPSSGACHHRRRDSKRGQL